MKIKSLQKNLEAMCPDSELKLIKESSDKLKKAKKNKILKIKANMPTEPVAITVKDVEQLELATMLEKMVTCLCDRSDSGQIFGCYLRTITDVSKALNKDIFDDNYYDEILANMKMLYQELENAFCDNKYELTSDIVSDYVYYLKNMFDFFDFEEIETGICKLGDLLSYMMKFFDYLDMALLNGNDSLYDDLTDLGDYLIAICEFMSNKNMANQIGNRLLIIANRDNIFIKTY